jgi:DNA recombination protein RmuC
MSEIATIIVVGIIILIAIIVFGIKILEGLPKKEDDSNIESTLNTAAGKIDTIVTNLSTVISDLGSVKSATASNETNYDSMIRKITDIERVFTTNQTRGNIGEKTVERIIEWVGLKDGKGKYWDKQVVEGSHRPDFTFYFPDGAYVHLDAKFPLDNYKKMIECDPQSSEEQQYKKSFKQDIQSILRGFRKIDAKKDYIDHDGKINFLMVFIPNMPILNFIRDEFDDIYEEFSKNHILLVGPSELYAILQFLRRAVENYKTQESSGEIVKLVDLFKREWNDKMLPNLKLLRKQFDTAESTLGDIETTRDNQLQKIIDDIENIDES